MSNEISNKRIYADINSAETIVFEHELENAGIVFYRHDSTGTWTDNTSLMYHPTAVYTFYEKDLKRAQQILDDIRAKVPENEMDKEVSDDYEPTSDEVKERMPAINVFFIVLIVIVVLITVIGVFSCSYMTF